MGYTAGNFTYKSKEQADAASSELEKIAKVRSQMDFNKPQVIYTVYCRMLDGHVFHTVNGICFLLEIREYLENNKEKLPGEIPYIPEDYLGMGGNADLTGAHSSQNPNPSKNSNASQDSDSAADSSDSDASPQEQNSGKSRKKSMSIGRLKARNQKLEENFMVCRIVIAFLVVIIIAMIVINAMGDSPTILNYKNQIENEYVDWQQQLQEKEDELNAREQELNQREANN